MQGIKKMIPFDLEIFWYFHTDRPRVIIDLCKGIFVYTVFL
jgi:hypothetical protein